MKVATKLGLGFGVVILLLLIIVVTAIANMASMNAQTKEIVEDRYSKTALVSDLHDHVNVIARAMRNIVILEEKDKEEIEKEAARIGDERKEISNSIEVLRREIKSENGKALLGGLVEANNAAIPTQDTIVKLAREGRDNEAKAILMGSYRKGQSALFDALEKLTAYQEKLMKDGAQEATADYARTRLVMIVVGIIAVLMGVTIAYVIAHSLVRQLGGEPDYATKVVSRIAMGDMTVNVDIKPGDNTSMLSAIKDMVGKLSQIVGEVRSAADNLSSASEEVSSTSQSMSQSTNEQAASVEETSASIEQMAASINQNSENAKVTDKMAQQAAQQASQGGVAVKETVEAMKQIAGKIGIIDDIAYQTNLLALNAAIEAARAGEHGKGFAVVAAEVRKLAERSQVAAQEIGELASGSVSKAEDAGKLLGEIVPAINKTSDLVQEITAASEEQSTGAAQINTAMSQISQTTQSNASATEQLASTAEEMSSQAEQLQELVSFFKVNGGSSTDAVKHSVVHTSVMYPAAKPAFKAGKAATKTAAATSKLDEAEFEKF